MELLVVVMVILLILVIGGNTYSRQRRHVQFTDSLVKVSNMINLARDYTITSRSIYDECQFEEEDRTYVPAHGYGVYFERSDTFGQSRIILFANTVTEDISGLNQHGSPLNQYNEVDGSPCISDFIEEEYMLPQEVEFVDISIDKEGTPMGGNDQEKAVIIFSPPLADATILANDNPLYSRDLVFLNDLYLHFKRPDTDPSAPSYYIHINKVAGFPEIEFE